MYTIIYKSVVINAPLSCIELLESNMTKENTSLTECEPDSSSPCHMTYEPFPQQGTLSPDNHWPEGPDNLLSDALLFICRLTDNAEGRKLTGSDGHGNRRV